VDIPRRILCPVDFSDYSHEALRVATELARGWRATLVLLHVEERPLWPHDPYMHLPGSLCEATLARAERQLDEWKREATQREAPDVVAKLVHGDPLDRIIAIAREDVEIGLIVLGTHGRTGLKRALIGSVAERVARLAPCTVMVVRSRA
jgi:nucleotide-binding universal stress UspA family protein